MRSARSGCSSAKLVDQPRHVGGDAVRALDVRRDLVAQVLQRALRVLLDRGASRARSSAATLSVAGGPDAVEEELLERDGEHAPALGSSSSVSRRMSCRSLNSSVGRYGRMAKR